MGKSEKRTSHEQRLPEKKKKKAERGFNWALKSSPRQHVAIEETHTGPLKGKKLRQLNNSTHFPFLTYTPLLLLVLVRGSNPVPRASTSLETTECSRASSIRSNCRSRKEQAQERTPRAPGSGSLSPFSPFTRLTILLLVTSEKTTRSRSQAREDSRRGHASRLERLER